jgi:hypothetical protein
MYLFEFFSLMFCLMFYLMIFFVFGSLVLLICCGPELKNTDLNIMSDNQSPRDIYELNNDIDNYEKDN